MTDDELLDLFVRLSEFLDNYVDVNDGDDGQPRPNRAMSLWGEVEQAIVYLQRRLPSVSEHGK